MISRLSIFAYTGWPNRFLLVLCVVLAKVCHAQADIVPDKHFDRYSGLLAKKVYTICNDPEGFIWLGTDNGLFRFDGRTFYHYGIKEGLCDNEILAMYSDSRGRIWCAGFNGMVSVVTNGVVDTVSHFIRHWPINGVVRDFSEDPEGAVYAVTETLGLVKVTPDGKFTQRQLLGKHYMVNRLLLINNTLYIGDGLGFYKVNPLRDSIECILLSKTVNHWMYVTREYDALWKTNPASGIHNELFTGKTIDLSGLGKQSISYVSQLDSSRVLVSLNHAGVFLYDLHTHQYRKIRLPDGALVPEVAMDAQRNIWMITPDNGLFSFKLGNNASAASPLMGFSGNVLGTVLFDGEIIMVTEKGEWAIVDKSRKKLRTHPDWYMTPHAIIRKYSEVGFVVVDDTLYVQLAPGQIAYKNGQAKYILRGNKKALAYKNGWLLGYSERLEYKNAEGRKVIFNSRTYSMCIQQDGVWFSNLYGLNHYDFAKDTVSESLFKVPRNGRIEQILPIGTHFQLLATNNSGLWLLWKGKTIIGKLDVGNGLSDNDCRQVEPYSGGWLVRHPFGLSKIERNGFRIKTVSEWKGLSMASVNKLAVCGDTLLLSTTQGTFQAGVNDLFTEMTEHREVKILNVISKGKSMDPEKVVLQPGGNHLRIDFAIPEYDHPERVQYQWRINEGPWNKTFNTSLEFADLSSGGYEFYVKARTPGFSWTKVSTLRFRVITPFWQAGWFWVLVCAAMLLLGWGIQRRLYYRKLATEREKASVRYQLMDFEQKALNAMMNPHFVFNAMGSIQHLLTQGDNRQANDYLVKFSRLIRKSLETSQLEFCYLDDEIERLTLYLQLEKMRFGGRMNFSITLSDDLDAEQVKIPTMILQTYVENAVIHGVAMVKRNADIHIRFTTAPGGIRAEIEDNGPGFDVGDKKKRSVRFGVSATEKRLELLTQITGKPYSVNIVSPLHSEGGTRVELLFSLS